MPCCGELQPVGATGQYHAYCETCRIPRKHYDLNVDFMQKHCVGEYTVEVEIDDG